MSERKFELNDKQVSELRRALDEATDGDTQTRYQAVRLYDFVGEFVFDRAVRPR